MAYKLETLDSINENDFSTPSTTRNHPLGLQVQVLNTEGSISVYEYVYAAVGALAINQPYVMNLNSGSVTTSVSLTAPVTLASGARVGVPQVAIASGYYGFVLVKGYGKALHKQETYIVGDFLRLASAGTALVVEGSSGSTIKTVNTCAITLAAGTTAIAGAVYLSGDPVAIAAS